MNKKQYNNVIENTLKHEQSAQTDDSLATARAIFDNMGVALPQGDIKTVYETISTDNYMGWKSCTMQEAQEAADKGVAAIGISEDRIVVLSVNDEEQPVTQTASVMTLNENTSAFAVDGLEYYSYDDLVTLPNILEGQLETLIYWARNAEGKNLQQCSEYFGVTNPNITWCAWFVRQCGAKAGLNFGNSDYPPNLSGLFGNVNFSSVNKPRAGDLVFIAAGNEYTPQGAIGHIGIVVAVEDGEIVTIEGNMSGGVQTSKVKEVRYQYNNGFASGYGTIVKIGRNS